VHSGNGVCSGGVCCSAYCTECLRSLPNLEVRRRTGLGVQNMAAVHPERDIPINWLVNPAVELVWEQIGFSPDPRWLDQMLAKIDEVLHHPRASAR